MSAISEPPRSSQTAAPDTAGLGGIQQWLRASPALIPCAIVVLLIVLLGVWDGGYFQTTWYPAALFTLALLAVTAVAIGTPRDVPRTTVVAVGLMAAYTAWTYLSITWADQQGLAWDGANRTVLYLLVLALFALWPMRTSAGAVLLGMLGLGIAAIGVVELLRLDASPDPARFMVDSRFSEPVGYINANVALWALAVWPCVFLASRREVPAPLRGLLLGAAGLLSALALMGQSRSWLVAVPLATLVYVVLVPGRVRATGSLLAVAVGVYLVSGSVLDVHDEADTAPLPQLVDAAASEILLMAAALTLLGGTWGLLDRRIELSPRRARTLRGASAAVAGAIILAAAVAALGTGDATSQLSDRWGEFKGGGGMPDPDTARFSSGQTSRYDFWVVAADLFREQPLRGIGVENFQAEYLKRGTSGEFPRYAHSLQMGVLSQTGAVGAALLFGAIGVALAGALGRRRERAAMTVAVRAAAVVALSYWLLHASVDWLWEFPALGAAAFAALGLALATGRPSPPTGAVPARHRRMAAAAVALPAAAVALSLAFPWLAQLQMRAATDTWRADPDRAFERLDRAADLNPLSPTPALTAGTIAVATDDLDEAKRWFEQALERDRESFYAVLELAAIAAEQGDRRRGLRLMRRASRLSPQNDLVEDAIARMQNGEPVGLRSLNRDILSRARQRAR